MKLKSIRNGSITHLMELSLFPSSIFCEYNSRGFTTHSSKFYVSLISESNDCFVANFLNAIRGVDRYYPFKALFLVFSLNKEQTAYVIGILSHNWVTHFVRPKIADRQVCVPQERMGTFINYVCLCQE